MGVIIIVTKAEVAEKSHVIPVLKTLSDTMIELDECYVVDPKVGGLHKTLMFLKEKKVDYETTFDYSKEKT
jgi:hypothetical protein